MKLLVALALAPVVFAQNAKMNTPVTSGNITATVQKFLFQPDPSGPVLANVSVCATTKNAETEAIDIALSFQKFDGTIQIKSSSVQVPSVQRDKPVCENFWLGEGRLLSVSFQEKVAPVVLSGFENPPIMIMR